jgi:hypothetical protein
MRGPPLLRCAGSPCSTDCESTPPLVKRRAPRTDGPLMHFASPPGEKCGLGVCPTERKSPIFCPHLGSGITTDHNWVGWKFSVGQAPRCDVSKLRAAGGNPRSTVRRIPRLTPRPRAGLWTLYISRATRQGRYNDSPRLQPWGMVKTKPSPGKGGTNPRPEIHLVVLNLVLL